MQKRAGGTKGSGTIALQATTIDAFVAARGVERVHVLEVDANGMDALVLEGAAQTLAARRIDVFAFEYHGTGFYGTCRDCRSLRGMLVRFEALGYACYWQGAHGGVALSPSAVGAVVVGMVTALARPSNTGISLWPVARALGWRPAPTTRISLRAALTAPLTTAQAAAVRAVARGRGHH